VRLDDLAREREPEPEAAGGALEAGVGLGEGLEHARQERRIDAHAVVAHRGERFGALARERHAHLRRRSA
jgi:hypothetical protein